MPAVSVVLPYRDAGKTILSAVHSILDQTFRDLELIAVDDGSSDGSAALLEGIDDPRLTRLRNTHGPGVVGASRTGIDVARAEWLARMDADDLSLPDRIAEQFNAATSDVDVVACAAELIDSCGEGMERYVDWVNRLETHEEISRSRFIECPVINPTSMVRREWLERVGAYHDAPWAEDHDLWLRLLEQGCRFIKLPQILFQWRDSPERLTRRDERYGDDARSRMRAHYLARIRSVREQGVVIAGAGPIGKKLALDLQNEGILVRGFFEVSPRRIGQRIHGAEVASASEMGKRWRSSILLGAVGLEGGRDEVRRMAHSHGRREGVDFWAVC
ncbi:glycosyltransferase [Haloferula sp.]|uniref:glycosyltransferase family 2 protein n=1 Tax=Haloferula sp. TaxID=2497595 RepID=UPI003C708A2C